MQRRWSAVLVKLLFVLVAFGWIAGCQTSELTSERPPEEANNLIEHTGVEAPATNPPVTIVEEQDKSIEMPSAEQKNTTQKKETTEKTSVVPQEKKQAQSHQVANQQQGQNNQVAYKQEKGEEKKQDQQDKQDKQNQSSPDEGTKASEKQSLSVTLSIDSQSIKGVILTKTTVSIHEGDTVLDVLVRATKEKRIQMEYKGRGGTAYVQGIDQLYEFDQGPTSGWMYSVNGEFISKSAGAVKVKDGDEIIWWYTLDLGRDL